MFGRGLALSHNAKTITSGKTLEGGLAEWCHHNNAKAREGWKHIRVRGAVGNIKGDSLGVGALVWNPFLSCRGP